MRAALVLLLLAALAAADEQCTGCTVTNLNLKLYEAETGYQAEAELSYVRVTAVSFPPFFDVGKITQPVPEAGEGNRLERGPLAGESISFYYYDAGQKAYVLLCGPVTTDPNGLAVCSLSGIPATSTCTNIKANYSGREEYKPSESARLIHCPASAMPFSLTNIFGSETQRMGYACLPLFILAGLLFSYMYVVGKSPLTLFDITTPRLPKPKKLAFKRVRRPEGWKQATRVYGLASIGFASTFARISEAYAKQLKEVAHSMLQPSEANAVARDIDSALAKRKSEERALALEAVYDRLVREYRRQGEPSALAFAMSRLQRTRYGVLRFVESEKVHAEAEKIVHAAAGIPRWTTRGIRIPGTRYYAQVPGLVFAGEAYGSVKMVVGVGLRALRAGTAGLALLGVKAAKRVTHIPTGAEEWLRRQAGFLTQLAGQYVVDHQEDLREIVEHKMPNEVKAQLILRLSRELAATAKLLNASDIEVLRVRALNPENGDRRFEELSNVAANAHTALLGEFNRLYADAENPATAARLAALNGMMMELTEAWSTCMSHWNNLSLIEAEWRGRRMSEEDYHRRVREIADEVLAFNQRFIERERQEAARQGRYPTTADVEWELDRQFLLTDPHERRFETFSRLTSDLARRPTLNLGEFEERARTGVINALGDGAADYREGVLERTYGPLGEARRQQIMLEELRELARRRGIGVTAESLEELRAQLIQQGGEECVRDIAVIERTWRERYVDEQRLHMLEGFAEQQGIQNLAELARRQDMLRAVGESMERVMGEYNRPRENAINALADELISAGVLDAGVKKRPLAQRIMRISEAESNNRRTVNILLRAARKAGRIREDLTRLRFVDAALHDELRTADPARREELLRVNLERLFDAGCLVHVGATEGATVRRRDFWSLVDILESTGLARRERGRVIVETEGERAEIIDTRRRLDELGVLRPGGAVTYEMTQQLPMIAQATGWYVFPIDDPKAINTIRLSKDDVPINVELWFRWADGTVERYDRNKHAAALRNRQGELMAQARKPLTLREAFEKPSVYSLYGLIESHTLHPLLAGLERVVMAATMPRVQELYAAKAFIEYSSQVAREFKSEWEKGLYSQWMADLLKEGGTATRSNFTMLRDLMRAIDAGGGAEYRDVDGYFGELTRAFGAQRLGEEQGGVMVFQRARVEEVLRGVERELGELARYNAVYEERYKTHGERLDLEETVIPSLLQEREELRRRMQRYVGLAAAARGRGDETLAASYERTVENTRREIERLDERIARARKKAEILRLREKAWWQLNSDLRRYRRQVRERRAELTEREELALTKREELAFEKREELAFEKREELAFEKEIVEGLSDALYFMYHVETVRLPMRYKTPRAHSAAYGASLFIPGGYVWGPMSYLHPIDHMAGKSSMGFLWGLTLSMEDRFGHRFFRLTRPFILARQGIPFTTDPVQGYKPHSWLKATWYLIKGETFTRPGEALVPRYKNRIYLDELRGYRWKLSPAGRYPREERFAGWHGLVPWLSYMLNETTGVRDENMAFTFLKDRLQQITPEQSRDLELRSRGPFSPANYNTWYTTYRGPNAIRMGAAMARFITFNYPHLATPALREAAELELLLKSRSLPEQLKMLEDEYEFLKPWRQLSLAYAMPPIAMYELTRWLVAKASYRSTYEERERALQSGLWRVSAGFRRRFWGYLGLSAVKWTAIAAAGVTAGPVGAGAAYGAWSYINSYYPVYPPNTLAQWFMKRRASQRYPQTHTDYAWKTAECPHCGSHIGVFAHWCPHCRQNVDMGWRARWASQLSGGVSH
ncbi:MAG: hypothetical protein QXH27_04695 [Candidatus Micrarchaeia archaeon]